MQKFLKYEIKVNELSKEKSQGKFVIEPLQSGFGTTIGNALRRVLLSNIPGTAVFAVRINHANHEFKALDGVKEDVTEIILNLKKLVISIDENVFPDSELETKSIEKWPVMKLTGLQTGILKASDIELPAGFVVHNPDLKICELTADKKFVMEIYATRGRGFKSFIENNELLNTISLIATDSNFSPVVRVGYYVEERKISKQNTTDSLTMEISTNGSISASDALAMAAKILMTHFEPIVNINERIKEIQVMREKVEEQKAQTLAIPIENLNLTVRSYNCLKRAGIQTVQELINQPKEKIAKIKNLGKKSTVEINKKLSQYGLKLPD